MTGRGGNEPTLYELAQMSYEARQAIVDRIREYVAPIRWARRCRRGWRRLTSSIWVTAFAIMYPAIYSAAYREGHRRGYRYGRRVAKPVLAAHNQVTERSGYPARHAKAD
jgi:hypothetical protein